jgi:hypothetical protein
MIRGPLRDLGLHDVFQLLDLGRKTGALRVSSAFRDDEGVVYFEQGRVQHATLRSAPEPRASDDPARTERVLRDHIEMVIWELASWGEGEFVFERPPEFVPGSALRLSVDSLLMAIARHADAWEAIGSRVAGLAVVPAFAHDAAGGAPLDLLPEEWEVLAWVDGMRDLRAIAAESGVSSIDVARAIATLADGGVVRLPGCTPAGEHAYGDVAERVG